MNTRYDAHVANFLKARFGLVVALADYAGFICTKGDYDLDCAYGTGRDVMGAALDYASGHDEALFDVLDDICAGKWY